MYVVHELHSGDRHSVSLGEALEDLQALTERLRRDCPWDREQTERTIVPHTVEEAYEVADAAIARDDAKLADELGDLLFQVYLLALFLQVEGGDELVAIARWILDELRELKEALAEAGERALETEPDPHVFEEVGDVLFAAVNVARRLNVDPELALRAMSRRFVDRVERAERFAADEGKSFAELELAEQDRYFDRAKEEFR